MVEIYFTNKDMHQLAFCFQGIEQFRQALVISPCNVAALYGLASGLLGMSKECVNSGAFGWGITLLEVSL